ncbi:MAG: hypothetical protein AMXMBFR23_25800 [Chloroflexota bacterium]
MPTVRTRAAALAVVALVVAFASLGRASAQTGERILSYDVRIEIEADGALLIDEYIVYDFGGNERRGILRDVPVRVHYDGTHDRLYGLEVIEVGASAGTPAGYVVEDAPGGMKRIRIGDADVTITGRHDYALRYRIRDALNGFASHDELYWNAIATGWAVPIDRATVEVIAPAEITRIACYSGYDGSSLPCTSATPAGDRANFAEGGLGAYEGVTVVVALPKGAVPEPQPRLIERWSLRRAFEVTPFTLGGAGTLLALVVGGVARVTWLSGRDRRYRGSAVDVAFGGAGGADERVPLGQGGPYPVEYAPPDGLRPGQVGLILDETAHTVDVTATLIDLAVRGYLRITELEEGGLFKRADWRLTKLKEPDAALLEYERLLLESLFPGSKTERDLSDLRTTFHSHLAKVQQALYEDAVARGWYRRSPDSARNRWVGIGIGALIAAALLQAGLAAWTHVALLGVPLVLGAIALLVVTPWMPSRTARGTAALTRVRGFQRFIATAESERARFAERAQLFTEYLPYAIVFGLTERWAKAFEGLATPPDTGWYAGSRPFAYGAFASSVGDFSVNAGGTLASTPGGSGSSGFSGGSSGGGVGGGGGGSW